MVPMIWASSCNRSVFHTSNRRPRRLATAVDHRSLVSECNLGNCLKSPITAWSWPTLTRRCQSRKTAPSQSHIGIGRMDCKDRLSAG